MDIDSKRKGRAVALIAALASWWAGGTASAQATPGVEAGHIHARALLENALRYADPAHKLVDPASGYPSEGWNHDPSQGVYLRSFTQLTAIGLYMELLADVAAGLVEPPGISRDEALTRLAHLVRSLRDDQRNPYLANAGLLGNFLDFGGGKRVGPLAADVDKVRFLEAFGPAKGAEVWKALTAAGWIAPHADDKEAAIQRGPSYGSGHFDGPLALYKDAPTRDRTMALLDTRVVMLIFGDNSNLSASAAKAVGALLAPEVKDRPGAEAIRSELEAFLEAQKVGYTRLYDAKAGLFHFGWDSTRDRMFGWEDLRGNWTTGHMDYFVNEFRGPATFVAVRFGLPADAIRNLGFKMKSYRPRARSDGRDFGPLCVLAPWEGSAFQALGLGLMLGELEVPSWRALLRDVVEVEVDFANSRGLPGFLSESYTGEGTRYTGSVGIPEITVSPKPRVVDAASLYTLGVAYSVDPDRVEGFLAAHWPAISALFTDHGPWEGYNVARRETIAFQTTAHTLSLALGLIGRGSEHMKRYLDSKGLGPKLATFFEAGAGADLLSDATRAFAWTAKDSTLRSSKEGAAFRVRGDQLDGFGIAFVANDPGGLDLSGGLLTLRYRSAGALEPITIDLKPAGAADAPGLIPRQVFARLVDTDGREQEVRVQLPATPGLRRIKEFVITYGRESKGPVDLTVTHLTVAPASRSPGAR